MSMYPRWTAPPATLELAPNALHVWRVNTRLLISQWQQFLNTLTADEHRRAEQYRLEIHRQHFMINRGILRSLLARYLHCAPATLQFVYGEYGKPALANFAGGDSGGASCQLCFNMSHSHGTTLYAIALNREIGIDLEYIRPINAEQLASRFFTEQEYVALCALPAQQQQAAFFKLWTYKEAWVKATGEGLRGLKQVDMAFLLAPQPTLENRLEGWGLHEIEVDSTYQGAIAVQGEAVELRYWLWDGEWGVKGER